MNILIIIILIITIVLLIISLVMYLIQDKIIFHAEELPTNYKFSFTSDFEEINLNTQDGNTLNGLLFKIKNSKGLILFFHNHSGNVEHWSRSALFMNKLGHDVLIMDYRGFGKSTGKFNELNFLKDSELWYNHALESYDEGLISVYGRGIGTNLATYVASLNKPKRLCLESPFYSFNHLVQYHYPYLPVRILLKYKFDNAKYFVDVKCKIYIFHGKINKVVPYKNSLKLYNLSKENTELYLIPEGNHYNLINNQFYLDKIKQICK